MCFRLRAFCFDVAYELHAAFSHLGLFRLSTDMRFKLHYLLIFFIYGGNFLPNPGENYPINVYASYNLILSRIREKITTEFLPGRPGELSIR